MILLFFSLWQCTGPEETPHWETPRQEAEYWIEKRKGLHADSRHAQYYLSKALEADPTYANVWLERALPHLQKGEFAMGFKYLNEAVRLEPIEYLGYRGCARLYYLHDSEGALKDLIELDSLTPNFTDAPWGRDIYYTMGIAEKRRGNLTEALRLFDRSVTNTTKERGEDWVDVKVFLYRGIVKLELQDAEGAIADFDRGIFYFNKFMEAHFYKGKALKLLGRPAEACDYFTKARTFLNEGYSYSNQMYAMVEEVLLEDINQALETCR